MFFLGDSAGLELCVRACTRWGEWAKLVFKVSAGAPLGIHKRGNVVGTRSASIPSAGTCRATCVGQIGCLRALTGLQACHRCQGEGSAPLKLMGGHRQ